MRQTVYLVRHGQTLFNQLHKIQGASDSPLTDYGISQAKIAKKYLEDNDINFDAAFSSTQERAVDTLELLTDQPYQRLKDFKEWNFGVFESESEALNPKHPGKNSYGDFFVEYGGESVNQVANRMNTGLRKLFEDKTNKQILVVTHGGAMHAFRLANLHDNDPERLAVPNLAFMVFEYDDILDEFFLKEVVQHDFSQLI
ncbi:MAG: phosphoglycerate mutase family protein [Lactobacillaceae bacterium]|nr:phosphoglycerate mutase family protein [Lactobacillaceae bacterium]